MATLEGTIHTRWAANVTLNGLLSASRVKTGVARQNEIPYASVVRRSAIDTTRADSVRVETVAIRISIFHNDYDAAKTIVTALIQIAPTGMDHDQFEITGGGAVLSMTHAGNSAAVDEFGVWRFDVDFLILHQL